MGSDIEGTEMKPKVSPTREILPVILQTPFSKTPGPVFAAAAARGPPQPWPEARPSLPPAKTHGAAARARFRKNRCRYKTRGSGNCLPSKQIATSFFILSIEGQG